MLWVLLLVLEAASEIHLFGWLEGVTPNSHVLTNVIIRTRHSLHNDNRTPPFRISKRFVW